MYDPVVEIDVYVPINVCALKDSCRRGQSCLPSRPPLPFLAPTHAPAAILCYQRVVLPRSPCGCAVPLAVCLACFTQAFCTEAHLRM